MPGITARILVTEKRQGHSVLDLEGVLLDAEATESPNAKSHPGAETLTSTTVAFDCSCSGCCEEQ